MTEPMFRWSSNRLGRRETAAIAGVQCESPGAVAHGDQGQIARQRGLFAGRAQVRLTGNKRMPSSGSSGGYSRSWGPAHREVIPIWPRRDGVKLHTKIFAPADRKEPLPFLLLRTPYGIEKASEALDSGYAELADDGYIFVFQDIRGKFGSEGTFVMQRPARTPGDTKGLDEGTDTYDTIEWLLRERSPNNGRVGMLGVSYDGWTTIMGALEPHPALKAISPQASPADMWLGDDFHHNGAFRLSYGFEYARPRERGRTSRTSPSTATTRTTGT